jgi:PPP family 3-phenylpropionic acid transporter
MAPHQYFSLGAGYFSFFAILGLVVPYLGLFLDGRGYNSLQIGQLLALMMAMRIISPNIWAVVADRTGRRIEIMRFAALSAFICFFAAWPDSDAWLMALALAAYSFFWSAILPQLEVLTLRGLGAQRHFYSRLRAWGSVGFIAVVISAGYLIADYGSEIFIYIGSFLLLLLLLALCLVREPAIAQNFAGSKQLPAKWLSKSMLLFMLAMILLQISHGPYYGFFALYMEQLGYSAAAAGLLISLGVIAEIAIFLVSGRWLERWGCQWVLLIALALTVVRWLLLALAAEHLPFLLLAQLLHAASFGMTHAAGIQFIHGYFSEQQQGRGQAIYNSVGFGVGGALGAWLAGSIWQQGQGATSSYLFSAVLALVAAALIMAIPSKAMALQHSDQDYKRDVSDS